MKIGNVKLDNNIFLAPMAGITDTAFRIICRRLGAGLVFSEMVSAKAMYYKDEKTHVLTKVVERERPVALQIFGSDADIMAYVVDKYLNHREDIDIIDINMGCPAPKIVKNGDGCALMKNPKLVEHILRKVVKVSDKPITAKFRMGWDKENINGLEIGKIAEDCGVSAIQIHGRTKDMFYSGKADWDYIKMMKESVNIPVIGNGDVVQPTDAVKLFNHAKCDAISIARGTIGNPWIFERILRVLEGKEDREPTVEEKINMAIEHLNLTCSIKGEKIGVREMRRQIPSYIKGLRNSAETKNKINSIDDKDQLIATLLEYLNTLTN